MFLTWVTMSLISVTRPLRSGRFSRSSLSFVISSVYVFWLIVDNTLGMIFCGDSKAKDNCCKENVKIIAMAIDLNNGWWRMLFSIM